MSDWPKDYKQGNISNIELERVYLIFRYKFLFHLVVVETTGKNIAFYPNFLLEEIKRVKEESIL